MSLFKKNLIAFSLILASLTTTHAQTASTPGNIQSAKVDASTNPLSSYIGLASDARYTVFIGSASQLFKVTQDVQKSLAAGNIAIYEHGVAINPIVTSSDQKQAIENVWGATGLNITTGGGGGGNTIAEIGCCNPPAQSDFDGFGGKFPALANANMPDDEGGDGTSMTDANEADLEAKMTVLYATPNMSKNIAPFVRPDPADTTDVFSTSTKYEPYRKLALFNGAIALDIPPNWILHYGSGAIANLADCIKWGIANHLRVTLSLSPWNWHATATDVYDPTFLAASQMLMTELIRLNAIPTEYIAQSYVYPHLNENGVTGDTDPNSVNQVGLYLSTLPVSAPGTAVPNAPGGMSEQQVLDTGTLISNARQQSLIVNTKYATQKLDTLSVSDLRGVINNNINTLGAMAYQDPNNVYIWGGQIGGGNPGSNAPLSIFIPTNGNFLDDGANMNLQGAGSVSVIVPPPANNTHGYLNIASIAQLQGKSNDSGIMFGIDDDAPVLFRYGKGLMFSDEFVFNTPSGGFLTFTGQGYNPSISGSTVDGWLHIRSPYTTDRNQIGMSFSQDGDTDITKAPMFHRYNYNFLFNVPLLLSGDKSSTYPGVGSSSLDTYLHLTNATTSNDNSLGLLFGMDSGAPAIVRYGTSLLTSNDVLFDGSSILFQSTADNSHGVSTISPDVSGALRISNSSYAGPGQVGIIFGTTGAGDASVTVGDDDGDLTLKSDHTMFTGDVQEGNINYANLPATAHKGASYFCIDCYSTMRASSMTQVGVPTYWNGYSWVDSVGNLIMH